MGKGKLFIRLTVFFQLFLLASFQIEADAEKYFDTKNACTYNGVRLKQNGFDAKMYNGKYSSHFIHARDRAEHIGHQDTHYWLWAESLSNAFATVELAGGYTMLHVVIDETWFNSLEYEADTYWSSYAILAHELGHHFHSHPLRSGQNRIQQELEADTYSGCLLRKMGASLDEAKSAMKILGTPRRTDTHPARHERLKAIETGWNTKSCRVLSDENPKNAEDCFTNHVLVGDGSAQPLQREGIYRNRCSVPVIVTGYKTIDQSLKNVKRHPSPHKEIAPYDLIKVRLGRLHKGEHAAGPIAKFR